MAQKTGVILVVGLSDALLGDATPRMSAFAQSGVVQRLRPSFPAVTTTVQSSMLTGVSPSVHGIVGNGWYDRESAELRFWKQSNRLVHAEKVWETARLRDPSVTTLNMCWWFNMYSTVEYSLTPRPQYKSDGRKIPDCYSYPAELRDTLQSELGQFPLFRFWGPASSIASSAWIAKAAIRAHELHDPTLTLVYLPHLDYDLQKHGPNGPAALAAATEVDRVVGDLLDYFEARDVQPIIVSEYAIEEVSVPIHVNRVLRDAGFLAVREEWGTELLDAGASRAFAAADHQVAHVYVRDADDLPRVQGVCEGIDGVAAVLDRDGQGAAGMGHARAGDLVLVSEPGAWFTYYYWIDDARAPDFARTVDIHRKPGYDPAELFIDPAIGNPKLAIGTRLLKKKLGFRSLMDVIPLDATLVRGSHGRVGGEDEPAPIAIAQRGLEGGATMPCEGIRDLILAHVFGA